MTTHYETLGLASDADAAQIKAAFRRASSAAHPDREGGSETRQQAVNEAYRVLSDPDMRKRYDDTGNAQEPVSLEDQARELMLTILKQELLGHSDDPIAATRTRLEMAKAKGTQIREDAGRHINRLEKMRKRISAKKGPNYAHALIDAELAGLEKRKHEAGQQLGIIAKARVLLNDLQCAPDEKAPASTTVEWDMGTMFSRVVFTGAGG